MPSEASSAEAQADLTVIRARAALVRTRTMLVNAVRGLTSPTESDSVDATHAG